MSVKNNVSKEYYNTKLRRYKLSDEEIQKCQYVKDCIASTNRIEQRVNILSAKFAISEYYTHGNLGTVIKTKIYIFIQISSRKNNTAKFVKIKVNF